MKHGYGIHSWPEVQVYKGYWQNSQQHGLGIILSNNDSEVRYGLWKEGKRQSWFPILKSKDIDTQLKAIEDQEDSSFSPPVKFYEKLVQVLSKSNNCTKAAD